MGFESFPKFEEKPPVPEEQVMQKKELPVEQQTHEKPPTEVEKAPEDTGPENAKEVSPEIQEKAERFDTELNETVKTRIDSGELTAEQADAILNQAEQLKVEDKAELADKLKEEQSSPESEAQKQAAKELQENITQYETAIDGLVERAAALGIEISPEALKGYLENLKNAEPGEEEWNKSFEDRLKELETQVGQMERMKQDGSLSSEKGAETQKEFKKSFDQLAEKLAIYAVKFAVAIFKGLFKGIMGAIKEKK